MVKSAKGARNHTPPVLHRALESRSSHANHVRKCGSPSRDLHLTHLPTCFRTLERFPPLNTWVGCCRGENKMG